MFNIHFITMLHVPFQGFFGLQLQLGPVEGTLSTRTQATEQGLFVLRKHR